MEEWLSWRAGACRMGKVFEGEKRKISNEKIKIIKIKYIQKKTGKHMEDFKEETQEPLKE